MERVKGVEPSQPAWKAGALPLSYTRKKRWSGKRDSNSRPPPWQGGALATELLPHMVDESGFEPLKAKLTDLQSVPFGQLGYSSMMATRNGFEPSTSSVTGWHSNQLNYQAILIYGGRNRARTYDPLLVRQVLSQLSYAPLAHLTCSYIL